MTDTTPEYWDADGSSLQTYTQNIEQWGGRHGVPPLRGSNAPVGYVPGKVDQPRLPDERTITLAGWVIGDSELEFRDNWRSFRRLLWRTDRQVLLTKRWRSRDGSTLYSATAQVRHAGGLEPSTFGPAGAKFTTDLLLAFPYFVGSPVHTGSHSGTFTINNDSDDTTRIMTLAFSAAATLTNYTTGRILTVPSAMTLTVDTFHSTSSTENIVTSGQPEEGYWMSLVRDTNTFGLSAGTVTVTYTPLYL